jgi:hypothetical protein
MSINIRGVLVGSATAALLTGSTSAASAMTTSIGAPSLTAKVLVSVPVTISCSPFDAALTPVNSNAFVSIEQASGKAIARGSGSTSGPLSAAPLPFTCDGADHVVNVDVTADPAGPPFKHGSAVVRGGASASAAQQCGPNCFFNFTVQSANLGPTEVKIH